MKLEQYLKEIEQFLKEYIEKAHCKTYVLGISGGVDSSLCAALARNAVGKDRLLCLIIPIESQKADEDDALPLSLQLPHDLKQAFRLLVGQRGVDPRGLRLGPGVVVHDARGQRAMVRVQGQYRAAGAVYGDGLHRLRGVSGIPELPDAV